MSKSTMLRIAALIIAAFIFNACDEDTPVQPGADKNYFPQKVGSYRIFNNYVLDKTTSARVGEPKRDSVVVTGTTTKAGKSGYVYASYIHNESGEYEKAGENYYYTDGNKYYAHSTLVTSVLENPELPLALPIEIGDEWLLIANMDATNWDVFSQDIVDAPLSFSGITGSLEGKFTIKGSRGAIETVETAEKGTHQAQKVTTTIEMNAIINTIVLGSKQKVGDMKFTAKIHNWYVDGVGSIKSITEPVIIVSPLGNLEFEGSESSPITFSN